MVCVNKFKAIGWAHPLCQKELLIADLILHELARRLGPLLHASSWSEPRQGTAERETAVFTELVKYAA